MTKVSTNRPSSVASASTDEPSTLSKAASSPLSAMRRFGSCTRRCKRLASQAGRASRMNRSVNRCSLACLLHGHDFAAFGVAAPAGARVDTVDKFQGQEAPVVIYSLATSSADDLPRNLEFLYRLDRLNVGHLPRRRSGHPGVQPVPAGRPLPGTPAGAAGQCAVPVRGTGRQRQPDLIRPGYRARKPTGCSASEMREPADSAYRSASVQRSRSSGNIRFRAAAHSSASRFDSD
jgi:hypothetical protein